MSDTYIGCDEDWLLTAKTLVKRKNTQEKKGAQRSWSSSILHTTALFEVGS